ELNIHLQALDKAKVVLPQSRQLLACMARESELHERPVDGVISKLAIQFIDEKFIRGRVLSAHMQTTVKSGVDVAEACAAVLAAGPATDANNALAVCRCVLALFRSAPAIQGCANNGVNAVLHTSKQDEEKKKKQDSKGAQDEEEYFGVFNLEESYAEEISEYFKFVVAQETRVPEMENICRNLSATDNDSINDALRKPPTLANSFRAGATDELELKTLETMKARRDKCLQDGEGTDIKDLERFFATIKLDVGTMPQRKNDLLQMRGEIPTLLQNRGRRIRMGKLAQSLQ
ncbi:unnamed protein product, partial [Prorocentrum cordatum]